MTNQPIHAAEKALYKVFCDDYCFTIPPYQRPYAWTTEQASELLDDLENAWQGRTMPNNPYFLGSIVLVKKSGSADADVVDGQQRLTTLTILFAVLRDLCPSYEEDIDKFIRQAGNAILGIQDRFRLQLRPRDASFFEKAVLKMKATKALPDPHGKSDAQVRMIENACLLRERVRSKGYDDKTLKDFVSYISQRCYLVVIEASDPESAFRIFSVLNSRGLDLRPTDILKAEIIGSIPERDRDAYTEKWEKLEDDLGRDRFAELFSHLRTIRRKQKMRETLVSEFRKYVLDDRSRNGQAFIDDVLTPYGEVFDWICAKRCDVPSKSREVDQLLAHLGRLDNSDWQPPAMEAFVKAKNDQQFPLLRFFEDLERLAYSLFLRRADVNERIQRYGALLQEMEDGQELFGERSSLQLSPQEKSEVLTTLYGEIYTNARIRLPLLLRLDAALSAGGAEYEHRIITVEHVLPQTVAAGSQWARDFPDPADREYWVHRLANLVLLPRRKNTQASNFDFNIKKNKYFKETKGSVNFALTNQVLSASVWTPETLKARQEMLINTLARIWRLR